MEAAFFDLDKTLIPGSSLYLLARGLRQRGQVRGRDIARFAWGQLVFRSVGSERTRAMTTARHEALAFVRGRSQQELIGLVREIALQRILPAVYQEMADVIDHHRALGRPTFLVTAAPAELAELVADGLEMTGALGTIAAVDENGRYTGRLAGPVMHGEDKAHAVATFGRAASIDLGRSWVYSDSINDRPLLELAGHPHAVNPDRRLRRVARRQGWPVIDLHARRRAVVAGLVPVAGGAATLAGSLAVGRARSLIRARSAPPLRRRVRTLLPGTGR